MAAIVHNFGDGKYTVIFHESGRMEALRNGEPWQDLTGNGLILAMLQDFDFLKEQSFIGDQQIDSLLSEVECLKKQIHDLQLKLEMSRQTIQNGAMFS